MKKKSLLLFALPLFLSSFTSCKRVDFSSSSNNETEEKEEEEQKTNDSADAGYNSKLQSGLISNEKERILQKEYKANNEELKILKSKTTTLFSSFNVVYFRYFIKNDLNISDFTITLDDVGNSGTYYTCRALDTTNPYFAINDSSIPVDQNIKSTITFTSKTDSKLSEQLEVTIVKKSKITDYLTYKLDREQNEITITGTTVNDMLSFTMPTNIEIDSVTYPVTSIGDYAFANNYLLLNISGLINSSTKANIASLGVGAFYNCISFQGLAYTPNNNVVLDFPEKVFYNCVSLKTMILSGANHYGNIGKYAFYNTNLNNNTPFTFSTVSSSNLKIVDDFAFANSSVNINTVISTNVATNLEKIGYGAFANTTKYTNAININPKTIASHAFYNSGLTGLTLGANVTSLTSTSFLGCTGITDVSISDNNPNYFASKTTILDKNKTIIYFAADHMVIFDTIREIKPYAINLSSYTGFKYSLYNIEILGDYCFGYQHTEYRFSEISIIWNRLKKLGKGVFSNFTNMATINLTAPNLTELSDYAFEGCTALTSVNINGTTPTITKIGKGTFKNCPKLTTLTGFDKVTSIEKDAFRNCSALTSITLGSDINYVGNFAFKNCPNLTISLKASEVPATFEKFWNADKNKVVFNA